MPSSWLLLSSEFSTPRPESFSPHAIAGVDAGLRFAATHLRSTSKRAHKSRCSLEALAAHTGSTYAQTEAVPDAVYQRFRDMHGLRAVELLPARAGSGTSVGTDAVLLLLDEHAAVKGLPDNELAARLCAACGLSLLPQGDAFLCRLVEEDGALSLGGDATAEMMGEDEWLQRAQKCARLAKRAGEPSPLSEALTLRLAAAVKVAAAQAQAASEAEAARTVEVAASGGAAPSLQWENGPEADVLVRVDVPAGTKAKHVACVFKAEWLHVEVATLPQGEAVLLDGKTSMPGGAAEPGFSRPGASVLPAGPLKVADFTASGKTFYPVEPEECSWALEDAKDGGVGRVLTVSLQKAHENMRWLDLIRKDGHAYHAAP